MPRWVGPHFLAWIDNLFVMVGGHGVAFAVSIANFAAKRKLDLAAVAWAGDTDLD